MEYTTTPRAIVRAGFDTWSLPTEPGAPSALAALVEDYDPRMGARLRRVRRRAAAVAHRAMRAVR